MRIAVALGFWVAAGCSAFTGSDVQSNGSDAGTWCANQGTHAFCADFDEGLTLTMTFNEVEKPTKGESISIDAAKSKSASSSMAVTVPITTGGGKAFGDVSLPSAPNGFTCAFDIALDGAATNVGSLVWVKLDPTTNLTLGKILVVDGGAESSVFGLPGSAFTRMELKVDLVALTATASREGRVLATVALKAPTAGTRTIHFGTLYPNSTTEFTLHYDNIVCDPL